MAEERRRMREFNLSDGHEYSVPEDKVDGFLKSAREDGLEAEEFERVELPGSGIYRIPKARREEFEKEQGAPFEDVDPRMTDDEWLAWRRSRRSASYRRARMWTWDKAAFDEEQKRAQFGRGASSSWESLDEDEARDRERGRADLDEAKAAARAERRDGGNAAQRWARRAGAAMADTAEGMRHAAEVERMPLVPKIANDAIAAAVGLGGGLLAMAGGGRGAAGAGLRRTGDKLNEWSVSVVSGAGDLLSNVPGFGWAASSRRRHGKAQDAVDAILPERRELRRLASLEAEGRLDEEGRARLDAAAEAVRSRVASLSAGDRARLVRALDEEGDANAVMQKWTGDLARYSGEIDDAKYGRGVEDIAGGLANSAEMAISYYLGDAVFAAGGAVVGAAGRTAAGRAVAGAASSAASKVAGSAAGRAAAAAAAKATAAVAARPMLRKGVEGVAKVARACAGEGMKSTLVMSLPEYASAYMDAVESGASDAQANAAGLWSFGVAAATEHMPLDAIANRKGAGFFRHLLEAAVNEGSQEYVQSLCGNAVNLAIWDRVSRPDGEKYALSLAAIPAYARALFEGAAEEGVAGGFAGMLMGGGARAVNTAAGIAARQRARDAVEKILSSEAATPEGRALRAALAALREANPAAVPMGLDPSRPDAENLAVLFGRDPAALAARMEQADAPSGVDAAADAYADRLVAENPELAAADPGAAPAPAPAAPAPEAGQPAGPPDRRTVGPSDRQTSPAPEAPGAEAERTVASPEELGRAVQAARRFTGGEVTATTAADAPDWVKAQIARGAMRETDRGAFDIKTGRIWLNAGAATLTTAAHEAVWHGTLQWAKENDPDLHRAMLDLARSAPKEIADMVRDAYGDDISEDERLDEIGALMLEMEQGGRIAEFLRRDPAARTWWEKVWDLFREIFRRGSGAPLDATALRGRTGADLLETLVSIYTKGGTLAPAAAQAAQPAQAAVPAPTSPAPAEAPAAPAPEAAPEAAQAAQAAAPAAEAPAAESPAAEAPAPRRPRKAPERASRANAEKALRPFVAGEGKPEAIRRVHTDAARGVHVAADGPSLAVVRAQEGEADTAPKDAPAFPRWDRVSGPLDGNGVPKPLRTAESGAPIAPLLDAARRLADAAARKGKGYVGFARLVRLEGGGLSLVGEGEAMPGGSLLLGAYDPARLVRALDLLRRTGSDAVDVGFAFPPTKAYDVYGDGRGKPPTGTAADFNQMTFRGSRGNAAVVLMPLRGGVEDARPAWEASAPAAPKGAQPQAPSVRLSRRATDLSATLDPEAWGDLSRRVPAVMSDRSPSRMSPDEVRAAADGLWERARQNAAAVPGSDPAEGASGKGVIVPAADGAKVLVTERGVAHGLEWTRGSAADLAAAEHVGELVAGSVAVPNVPEGAGYRIAALSFADGGAVYVLVSTVRSSGVEEVDGVEVLKGLNVKDPVVQKERDGGSYRGSYPQLPSSQSGVTGFSVADARLALQALFIAGQERRNRESNDRFSRKRAEKYIKAFRENNEAAARKLLRKELLWRHGMELPDGTPVFETDGRGRLVPLAARAAAIAEAQGSPDGTAPAGPPPPATAVNPPDSGLRRSAGAPAPAQEARRHHDGPFAPGDVFEEAEGAREVPLAALRTLKDEPAASVAEASRRMEEARAGRGAKRAPLVVADNGDGTYTVVDGTATAHAIAGSGGAAARVVVAGPNRGSRLANSLYAVREEGVRDASGGGIALRTQGLDGLDPKGVEARERAYAYAEANLPALEELTAKAAKEAGGKAALHPENRADSAGVDPREVGKRIKRRSRVESKKADYGGDYSGVADLIGTTVTLPPSADMGDALKAIRSNLPDGASVARVKFLSSPDNGGYWDVKVSVRFANGGLGEIILADENLTEAKFKRGGHDLYDFQRAVVADYKLNPSPKLRELRDGLREIELAIYAHNTPQAEARRAAWDSAKASASSSLTRLEGDSEIMSSISFDIGKLKDLLSGSHIISPASVNSVATPARSFIQNDISSSPSGDIEAQGGGAVKPPDSGLRYSRGAPAPAGRSAAARAVREAFPEATWGALRKSSARSWEYDPDGKRILVRDPADPAAALRAAGAHADLRHLGDASGLMLHRASAMEAMGHPAAADAVRRAEAELRSLGAAYAGPKASALAARRAGFAEAFARAIEDPAALRRDAPAAARYLDACLAEAPAALGRKLSRVREAQTRAALATPDNAIKLFMQDPTSGASGAGMGEMVARTRAWARSIGDRVQETLFDELHGIVAAFRDAGVDEAALPPTLDPWRKATAYRKVAPGRVESMLWGDGIQNVNGDTLARRGSLKDALDDVRKAGKIDDFREYAVARVAKMRNARGTPSGLTDAECDAAIARLDSPLMRKALDDFTAWNHAVMHQLVECGAWTEEEYQTVVAANPVYAPFHRRLPPGHPGAGRDGAAAGVPVRKFKGSNLEIHDPIESACLNASRIAQYALVQDVKQTFAKCLDHLRSKSEAARGESQRTGEAPGPDALRPLAKFMEEVAAPVRAVEVGADEAVAGLRKAASAVGADVDEALDALASALDGAGGFSIFRRADAPAGVERIVVDGKERYFRPGEGMARVLKAVRGAQLSDDAKTMGGLLGAFTKALRSTATDWNIGFALLRNPSRDAGTIAVTSEYLPPVKYWAQISGAVKRAMGDEAARDYFRSGLGSMGALAEAGEAPRASAADAAGEVTEQRRMRRRLARWTVGHVGRLASAVEANPRVAEYCAARAYWKKQGMSDADAHLQAACAAKSATVDFSRFGKATHLWNILTAFVNARLQGLDTTLRAYGLKKALPHQRFQQGGKRAARTMFRSAVALSLTGLARYMLICALGRDKDRRKLPDQEKWNQEQIPFGDQFFKLPLTETMGVTWENLPIAVLEYQRLMADGDEDGARRELRGYLEAATGLDWSGDRLPRIKPGDITAWVIDQLPTAVAPIIAVAANKKWNGQPIVPRELEKKDLADQFDETTWGLCRAVGPAIGYAPLEMQYILNQWTGSIVDNYAGALSRSAPGDDLRRIPILGKQFIAPGRSRAYGDYHDRRTNLSAAVQRCREAAADGEEPPYQVTLEDIGRLALDEREADAIRELAKRRSKAMKDPERTVSERRVAATAADRELTAKLEGLEAKTEAECRDAGLVRCARALLRKEGRAGDHEAALRILRESGATYAELSAAWAGETGRGEADMYTRGGKLTPFGQQLDRLWRLSQAGWREGD